MVVVYASKGPLAGRQVDIPEDQVEAATGKSGWALKIEPGVQLLADPGAEYDPKWVIPGFSQADLSGAAKPTSKAAASDTSSKESSSKTSAAATASAPSASADTPEPASKSEPEPDEPAATKTKASSK